MKFKFDESMKTTWAQSGGNKPRGDTLDRHGFKWTTEEKAHLIYGYIDEGLTIPQLAKRHGRGLAGIASQLNECFMDRETMATLTNIAKPPAQSHLERREVIAAQILEKAFSSDHVPAVFKTGKFFARPNADVIKYWADGETVEFRCPLYLGYEGWTEFHADRPDYPGVGQEVWRGWPTVWRVKPKTVVQTWNCCIRVGNDGKPYISHNTNRAPNTGLTFTDGVLTSAVII